MDAQNSFLIFNFSFSIYSFPCNILVFFRYKAQKT